MPPFGGFNLGNIGGALVRNVVGDVASMVLPRSAFGSFGLRDGPALVGQQRMQQNAADRRVSLRPKPAAAERVYGKGLLKPLAETEGLVWPYTPTISYNHNIDYQPITTVHANQDFHVYSRTPAVELQVSGDFSVQNQKEGRYALAAIHFLRTMAKMNFGDQDPDAGTPPPVLLFNAYGPFVFSDVPVIVKSFSAEFPDSVDYVEVAVSGSKLEQTPARTPGGIVGENLPAVPGVPPPRMMEPGRTPRGYNDLSGPFGSGRQGTVLPDRDQVDPADPAGGRIIAQNYTVWLPSVFKISANLIIQHTPKELRSRFTLPKFRDGDLSQKDFV